MRDVVISRKPSIFAVLFHANFGLVEKSIKVFTLTLYYFVFPHWWSFIENWAWGFWTNKAMSRACTTVFQFFRVVNGWNMRIWLPYEHMAQTQRATKKNSVSNKVFLCTYWSKSIWAFIREEFPINFRASTRKLRSIYS